MEVTKNELPICEKNIIVPSIGLLLQIHNKLCALHTCSSIVEFLKT
jgi:hypothetical protein